MQNFVNCISHKLRVAFAQNKGFKHASGVIENLFEVIPSITSEDLLLEGGTNIICITDLESKKECMLSSKKILN